MSHSMGELVTTLTERDGGGNVLGLEGEGTESQVACVRLSWAVLLPSLRLGTRSLAGRMAWRRPCRSTEDALG